MAKRIQQKRTKGWRMPEGARSVARPTKFGNPFTTSPYTGCACKGCLTLAFERELSCFGNPETVIDIRGKNLACWCPLTGPCHASPLKILGPQAGPKPKNWRRTWRRLNSGFRQNGRIDPPGIGGGVMSKIKNRDAWLRGKEAAIKRNASKTRKAKWLAVEGNQELSDWLTGTGDFGMTYGDSYDGGVPGPLEHLCRGMFAEGFGDVLLAMRDNLHEWGGLTDKQTALVRAALDRQKEWVANAAVRKEAEIAARIQAHIGTVGERMTFEGTVRFTTSGVGHYGTWTLTIVDTDAGTVSYFNSLKGADKGDKVQFDAKVKAHEERDGELQTAVSRATKITVEECTE